MPMYHFTCVPCGYEYDELYWVMEEKNPVCPKCGQQQSLQSIAVPCDWIAPHPAIFTGRYPLTPGEKQVQWEHGRKKTLY